MRRAWARAAVGVAAMLAAAALTGCQSWHCDFESHGACIEFKTDPPDLEAARARVDRLLDLELRFWGLSNLNGWRVQFRSSAEYACYLASRNDGCTDYLEQTLSVRVPAEAPGCFEAAELLHELGHYELGDPMHSNSRWKAVEAAFAPMVWDRPDAPSECVEQYEGVTSGIWAVRRDGF